MTFLLHTLKWLFVLALLLAAAVYAFLSWAPVFGGQPDAASLAKMRASRAFDGEKFNNLEETPVLTREREFSLLDWLRLLRSPPPGKNPSQPLPSQPFDARQLQDGRFVWFGHSTVLFQLNGKRILTDPVYHQAAPLWFAVRPFAMQHTPRLEDLPALDAVLISHDHYDHLDHQAIRQLHPRVAHFYVPLGVKAHLQRWSVPDAKVTELDWHESAQLGPLRLTLTPARHFSGRRLNNRFSTLWGAWAIKSPALSLFFGADSGWGAHFADIARQHGPFDLAMLEAGAYNRDWALIHETPEQAVQAAQTLHAAKVLPIHWAKFDLAPHPWKEPIERLLQAAQPLGLDIITPQIGQVFSLDAPPRSKWWQQTSAPAP